METAKLEKFKALLIKEHGELTGLVESNLQASREEVVGDVPDVNDDATRSYNRQVMMQLGEQERKQIRQIEDALDRIKDGQYGVCVDCGTNIPEKRLELVPHATHCVKCLEKIEKQS